MAETKLASSQVTGGGGSATETFSGNGSGTSITVTAASTVLRAMISLANTTDSVYITTTVDFAGLSGAQTVFGELAFQSAPEGLFVKCARDSGGTGLTITLHTFSDADVLAVGAGGASPGAAIGMTGKKYIITCFE